MSFDMRLVYWDAATAVPDTDAIINSVLSSLGATRRKIQASQAGGSDRILRTMEFSFAAEPA